MEYVYLLLWSMEHVYFYGLVEYVYSLLWSNGVCVFTPMV